MVESLSLTTFGLFPSRGRTTLEETFRRLLRTFDTKDIREMIVQHWFRGEGLDPELFPLLQTVTFTEDTSVLLFRFFQSPRSGITTVTGGRIIVEVYRNSSIRKEVRRSFRKLRRILPNLEVGTLIF